MSSSRGTLWDQTAWWVPIFIWLALYLIWNQADFSYIIMTLAALSVSCFIVFRKFNFSCLFESYFLKVISVLMMIGISSFMLVVMAAFEFNNGRLPFIAVGFDIVVFSLILIFPIVFISRFFRSRGVDYLGPEEIIRAILIGIAGAYLLLGNV